MRHDAAARVLLAAGADPNMMCHGDLQGQTLLGTAVGFNCTQSLYLLLAARANPNIIQEDGFTALSYAVFMRKDVFARILLSGGGNPDIAPRASPANPQMMLVYEQRKAQMSSILAVRERPMICTLLTV